MARQKPDITSLYYITHVDNLPSILDRGILSHDRVEAEHIDFTRIYDAEIVGHRRERQAPDGNGLWHFANAYFQPRNPMLYRVLRERSAKEIAIVAVSPSMMATPGVFVTDGNAASGETQFFTPSEGRRHIRALSRTLSSDYWNATDGSKRKIMAEYLVPRGIPPESIHTIFVSNHTVAEAVRATIGTSTVPVIPEPYMFFIPTTLTKIANRLVLVDGDMFFSKLHTLTVSVNVKGIMGKGLASRAKYQFPDVYVTYQDACRSKQLRMGRPYLYKREALIDQELADDPASLPEPNARKWFLLFATKDHWREPADLGGIEAGLRWIKDNYEKEGIRSLAVPALGCGLGQLEWSVVGPLMCRELSTLPIDVAVYLPRERDLPKEQLTAEFLVGRGFTQEIREAAVAY